MSLFVEISPSWVEYTPTNKLLHKVNLANITTSGNDVTLMTNDETIIYITYEVWKNDYATVGDLITDIKAKVQSPVQHRVSTVDPTVNDDISENYVVGSEWVNTTNNCAYICVDSTLGAAIWTSIISVGGGGGDLLSTNNLSDVGDTATALSNLNGETAFTKNTAFNKDFGTTAGTVLEGDTIIGGGFTRVTETTATRTASVNEFILINVVTCTITLPAPSDNTVIALKAIVVPTDIQIKTSGVGVNIDGTDYSTTGLSLTSQWEQISLISDGTHWYIY